MTVERADGEPVGSGEADHPASADQPLDERPASSVSPRRSGIVGQLGHLISEIGQGNEAEVEEVVPVSYTHLTLPTIYSV